ncbi:MAG TPA: CRISPR system precrRNA processing endoribonuclease RAMP protein Cas6 [Bryobacteraceae bacterium]|nr:CRISPR system precrRNA processing endoribonuclease RAMP protein Cas6 [Bryobacteraceae bacterium]
MGESFELLPYRLTFQSKDSLTFPTGQPGNILRGAFGTIFRRLVCVPPCVEPATCDRIDPCPYARIFHPRAAVAGPSGLVDRPRPFVFRAHDLDGLTVPPGAMFHFDLHLFELKAPLLIHFIESLKRLSEEGVGPGRGRAALVRVDSLGGDGAPAACVYDPESGLIPGRSKPLLLDLSPQPAPVGDVLIRFLSPTELKWKGVLAGQPEFPALFGRVRDRLSSLAAFYGRAPLSIDFKGLGDRAARVRMVRSRIAQVSATRRSSRTGQTHPIGGFMGEAEYEGELAEFLPYLRAAQWTGVGRQTVWGNGAIEVRS